MCRRLIFCLLAARAPLVRWRGVCRQYGLAYAYNEKPCPVTIDKTLRYEGVHIMSYIAL
nr:MAG TPA: hypothetical protein [Caudoviricetes sp.]